MKTSLAISPDLRGRIDAVAERTGSAPTKVVADALENGHSLDWQEAFARKTRNGQAAADRGEFVTESEIEAVRQKYCDA